MIECPENLYTFSNMLNLDITAVAVATIPAVAAIIVALVQLKAKERVIYEKAQVEAELGLARDNLDFSMFIKDWGAMHADIRHLMDHTPVDRFLILRAWNGTNSPKWTTAVLQIRDSMQETIQYIHFDLDADYVDRLREIAEKGHAYYVVDQMPRSRIKDIYDAEGVKASVWAMIEKRPGPKGTQSITYCSFSTHDDGLLDQSSITKCMVVAGHLRGTAQSFYV